MTATTGIDLDRPGAPPGSAVETLEPLAPLPKRVADELAADAIITDPVEFTAELLARATQLLKTLEHDVEHLEADQDGERRRIEAQWQHQQEAVDAAGERLERMHRHARQIAAHKARSAEFEAALKPLITPAPPDEVTVESFARLLATIDSELKAALGITGAIRLPQIAQLLVAAEQARSRLAELADESRQSMLAATEDELTAEGREARASFEIGSSILERDLALLDSSLSLVSRPWSAPEWDAWEPPAAPAGWVRLGALTHPRLPDAPVPYLIPATGGPGLVLEGGAHREAALDGLRSLVLRLLAAAPPGLARFTFIDPKGLGESIAPFLALAEYDASLVGSGALTIEADIEEQLEQLSRHIERIVSTCLQGRHATLDDYHAAMGEVVEPYRYVVVIDHPTGLSDRAATLLRAVAANGPRCGVTTLVLRTAKTGFTRAGQGLPEMPTVKSTAEGLVVASEAGSWTLVPDRPPLLATGEAGATFDRIVVGIGEQARIARGRPVTPSVVFELMEATRRRRVRDDLPRTTSPVDPDLATTWWTGDATAGLGVPVGRTPARQPVALWFDQADGVATVTGTRGSGVTTLLQTVVDGLAVLYPPEECQLLLVGVGDRETFAPYGAARLPHARLVASGADRELALSVLDATLAIVDRRRDRLEVAGTSRVGLAGHREQTGERLPRLLLVIDGAGALLDGTAGPDAMGTTAGQLLARLAAEGPAHGVHLLLADRVEPAAHAAWRERLPRTGTNVELGASTDECIPAPGDAVWVDRNDVVVRGFRVASSLPHERAVTVRDLTALAAERAFTATPQIYRGDQGAELSPGRLAALTGEPDRQAERRTPRLLLGEPVGLGAPVEVLLRRQEGANVLVVSDEPVLGQGVLLSALSAAAVVHGPALESWVLDFLPFDPGLDAGVDGGLAAGLGAAALTLADRSTVHVGRRRVLAKTLDEVHRLVQDRLSTAEVAAPPCLLVVSGLGRARDFDRGGEAHDLHLDALDPAAVLEAILRDGPEVGVHTLVWCETVELLHRRLGPRALREFGIRVGTAMSEEGSIALLDRRDGAELRPNQALLYDESRGRLVKFRPYALPAPGWAPV